MVNRVAASVGKMPEIQFFAILLTAALSVRSLATRLEVGAFLSVFASFWSPLVRRAYVLHSRALFSAVCL